MLVTMQIMAELWRYCRWSSVHLHHQARLLCLGRAPLKANRIFSCFTPAVISCLICLALVTILRGGGGGAGSRAGQDEYWIRAARHVGKVVACRWWCACNHIAAARCTKVNVRVWLCGWGVRVGVFECVGVTLYVHFPNVCCPNVVGRRATQRWMREYGGVGVRMDVF